MSNESVFITSVINVYEGKYVVVVNIPRTFMQADMDETVHARFISIMVDQLLAINRELYDPYIMIKGDKQVM